MADHAAGDPFNETEPTLMQDEINKFVRVTFKFDLMDTLIPGDWQSWFSEVVEINPPYCRKGDSYPVR